MVRERPALPAGNGKKWAASPSREDLSLQDGHILEGVPLTPLTPALQCFGPSVHVPETGEYPGPAGAWESTFCPGMHRSPPPTNLSEISRTWHQCLGVLRLWRVPQFRVKRATYPANGGGVEDLGLPGRAIATPGRKLSPRWQRVREEPRAPPSYTLQVVVGPMLLCSN